MSDTSPPAQPVIVGRIGVTLLCIYLLAVTIRIGGCYAPELGVRDDLPQSGPAIGQPFPDFTLRDVSGKEIGARELRGVATVIAIVPSLDWSAPTKARVLDLAEAVAGRRDLHVAVVLPSAQASPRSLAFVRDRTLPLYVLIDDAGLIERLGLATPAPDGTVAAQPAIFALDAEGRVLLRDVRKEARSWLAAPRVLAAALAPGGPAVAP
jgi:peroxiredoxin